MKKNIYFGCFFLLLAPHVWAQNIDYTLHASWSYADNTWRDNVRRTYSHENGNLAMVYSEIRYPDSVNWVPAERTQNEYNNDGAINTSLTQSWNENSTSWENKSRTISDYSDNGSIVIKVNENWIDEAWIPETKTEYSYDSNTSLTEKYFLHWDALTGAWLFSTKYQYSYNPDGKISNLVTKSFQDSQWVYQEELNYSYTDFGKIAEIAEPLDTAFDGSISGTRKVYKYDDDENLIYALKEIIYQPTQTWKPLFQFDFTNNDDGSVQSYSRQVNSGLDSTLWVNFGRLTYFYLIPTHIKTPEPLAFALFPNPTKDQVYIQTNNSFEPASYKMLTIEGKTLFSGILNSGNQAVSTSSLAAGIYLLELRVGDKIGFTKLFKD